MSDQEAGELVQFLKLTKEGQYTPIKPSNLKYVRIQEVTRFNDFSEDEYYYGLE